MSARTWRLSNYLIDRLAVTVTVFGLLTALFPSILLMPLGLRYINDGSPQILAFLFTVFLSIIAVCYCVYALFRSERNPALSATLATGAASIWLALAVSYGLITST